MNLIFLKKIKWVIRTRTEPVKIWIEPEPKFRNTQMELKYFTLKTQNPNKSEPNPNG